MGRPIAQALAEAGATVIIASRDKSKRCAFAAELTAESLCVKGEKLDLTLEADIHALRDRILRRHRHLDVLVNNAVARGGGDLMDTTAEEWESSMRVNSTGLFLACRIFSEPMQARHSGSIVNISSIYGMVKEGRLGVK